MTIVVDLEVAESGTTEVESVMTQRKVALSPSEDCWRRKDRPSVLKDEYIIDTA